MNLENNNVISETEQKLLDALDRLVTGKPLNTKEGRKLSASAVEDEAMVSRSLSRHYPETFQKIKEAIVLEKARKGSEKSINVKVSTSNEKALRDEIKKLKEENKSLKSKCDKLIAANIGLAENIKGK